MVDSFKVIVSAVSSQDVIQLTLLRVFVTLYYTIHILYNIRHKVQVTTEDTTHRFLLTDLTHHINRPVRY